MAPPFCNLSRKLEHTNGPNLGEDFYIGPKSGLNLSEDLFFLVFTKFWQENGLLPSEEIFLFVFIILKFPGPPPPLENPAYATAQSKLKKIIFDGFESFQIPCVV